MRGTGYHESVGRADQSLVQIEDDPRDELAKVLDGAFVVVVKATGGRYRRRCFLTAAPAEKAALKATQAGHNAEVFLAQLKPLFRLVGGAS